MLQTFDLMVAAELYDSPFSMKRSFSAIAFFTLRAPGAKGSLLQRLFIRNVSACRRSYGLGETPELGDLRSVLTRDSALGSVLGSVLGGILGVTGVGEATWGRDYALR